MYPYVTRMSLVCYSYVTRMLLVVPVCSVGHDQISIVFGGIYRVISLGSVDVYTLKCKHGISIHCPSRAVATTFRDFLSGNRQSASILDVSIAFDYSSF